MARLVRLQGRQEMKRFMKEGRKPVRIFIAGDSTAATYPQEQEPMAGWGQMIGRLFGPEVEVVNEARCGRSSKSFIAEGHLQRIEEAIGAGDYLMIQFGHNDQKPDEERHTEPETTYPEHLARYIELAVAKNAQPVLLTSVERRHFDEAGELTPSHGAYPDAMRKLARERGVPLLDLCPRTQELYRSLGPENSKRLFVWLKPNEHPNYPDGVQDDTHFNEDGAAQVAALVAEEIRKSDLPLKEYLI